MPPLLVTRPSLLTLLLVACLDTELPQRHPASNALEERVGDPMGPSTVDDTAAGTAPSDSGGGSGGSAGKAGSAGDPSMESPDPNIYVPAEPGPDTLGSDDVADECDGADRAEQSTVLDILATVDCRRVYVDDEDWFLFELAESAVFTYGATSDSGVTSHLYVEAPLYRPEEALDSATWNASSTPRQLPLERGIYLLQVGGVGLYEFSLSAERYSTPEPANDLGEGPESALPVDFSRGQAAVGGYVGMTDTDDFYAFTLSADTSLLAAFTDLRGTVTGSVQRRGDPLGQSEGSVPGSGSASSETRIPLAAGEYLFRVTTGYRTSALYTLTLRQEPNP